MQYAILTFLEHNSKYNIIALNFKKTDLKHDVFVRL